MTLDLEKFVFIDGKTPLSAEELNRRFYSLVRRLHELEQLKVDWEAAVAELQNAGLERINSAVIPLVDDLAADLDALIEVGNANLEAWNGTVTDSLAAWGAAVDAKLAEVDAAQAQLTADLAAAIAQAQADVAACVDQARQDVAVAVATAEAAATALAAILPAGAVLAFAMAAAPAGWLKCNGAAISRTTYAALFAAIGTVFGAGDGSTTFNLPDLRGEFVRGWDDGRGADAGRTLGSAQASANLSHSHGVNDPSHRHTTNYSGYNPGSTPANQVMTSVGNYLFGVNSVSEFSVTGISIAANGASEARPRNIALLYCVKY
ncbi:tail fiber protein [Megalodesulfovibrio paquesii]